MRMLIKYQQAKDNMKSIQFETAAEFETLFKKKTEAVTDAIVESIELAMMDNKKIADIFEVSIIDADTSYIISLNKAEWTAALTSCLDHYHTSQSDPDKAIDTWKLLEAAKVY